MKKQTAMDAISDKKSGNVPTEETIQVDKAMEELRLLSQQCFARVQTLKAAVEAKLADATLSISARQAAELRMKRELSYLYESACDLRDALESATSGWGMHRKNLDRLP